MIVSLYKITLHRTLLMYQSLRSASMMDFAFFHRFNRSGNNPPWHAATPYIDTIYSLYLDEWLVIITHAVEDVLLMVILPCLNGTKLWRRNYNIFLHVDVAHLSLLSSFTLMMMKTMNNVRIISIIIMQS